jgi:ppGpp synthetase/RelA/SpoT-type nucleotidyltranferase
MSSERSSFRLSGKEFAGDAKGTMAEIQIRKELKRCADEIAATDISMQTIRDMLENDFE